MKKLALFGGKPMIKKKLPARRQFDENTELAVSKVFKYYKKLGKDFGASGYFKDLYCQSFSTYLDSVKPGYTEAVSSGTVAVHVALLALNLPKHSHVLISPITDPGMLSPIILNKLKPKLIDFDKKTNSITLDSIKSRVDSKTKAIILNHLAGRTIKQIKKIYTWASANNIRVIEDASQCHGGEINGRKIGTFSDISCFSTMFSKNHSSGGAGGLIYTGSKKLNDVVKLESDKGKPKNDPNFNEKNPNTFLKPAMNYPLNEISAAIGNATLKKLNSVNLRRRNFLYLLQKIIEQKKLITKLVSPSRGDAPYFASFIFNKNLFNCSKDEFTRALMAEGVELNSDYKYSAYSWGWAKPYFADNFCPRNANEFLKNTFNLLFNENYARAEALIIAESIEKVEKYYSLKS